MGIIEDGEKGFSMVSSNVSLLANYCCVDVSSGTVGPDSYTKFDPSTRYSFIVMNLDLI